VTGLPTPPTTRFQTDVAGCALSSAGQQDPRACRRPVIRAGLRLVLDPEPRLFLCFACDQHASQLDAPRPLRARDAEERAARRRRAQTGHADTPAPPMAVGRDAVELHARALAWAARHTQAPEQRKDPDPPPRPRPAPPLRSAERAHQRSPAPAARDGLLEEQMRGYQQAADIAGTLHELPSCLRSAVVHVLTAARVELSNGRPLPIEVRRAATHLQRALTEIHDAARQHAR